LVAALAGLAAVGLAGWVGMVGGPAAAHAEPTATGTPAGDSGAAGPPIGPATPGQVLCTVDNSELDEVTGLVATSSGIYAVEGGTTFRPDSVEIWTINPTTCEATRQSHGFFPIDPQDLGVGTDGALWVADIGLGDGSDREWLTMERVDLASGNDAVPYRALVPPTGQINGSAVLLDANNLPIIIANASNAAVLYRPSAALPADTTEGLPTLQEVGQFRPINTDTPTPRDTFGRLVVTGAAVTADRTKVVLRTESDAYEFAVPDGDIVKAITEGTPVITPLPDESGQAITYSADGSQFLTLSFGADAVLRAYQPFVPQAEAPPAPPPPSGGGGITFGDITRIALTTGFLGLIAVAVGVVGIVRFRRQNPQPRSEARSRSDALRGRGDDRRRDRVGLGRGPGRRDADHDADDGYDGYDDFDDGGARPGRAPRPRVGSGHAAGGTYGPGGGGPGAGGPHGSSGSPHGSGTTYGSSGSTYGTSGATHGSGTTYGSGGTTYGSGGTTYGSGGTTYGSGGTTYGSGGRSSGSSGRASVPGGRPSGPSGSGGSGSGGGGVYGRARPDPDDDEPRHPYGRDNIDL
jgi:hypothetical protein